MIKYIIIINFCFLINGFTQVLPNLPIPLGAGTAEVWDNEIYYFGGSNNWAGSTVYPRIYRFDGFTWSYFDSIPDYNLWDVESVLVGDEVFLISGWPSGPDYLRKYNMITGNWTYLASSPNTTQTWGVAAEYLDGYIYLFNSYGEAYAYNIVGDTWSTKTPNSFTGTWDLSSILYQNEIYIIGYDDTTFFKYTPLSDDWTQLANSPYQVGACAMGIINDSIFCVGGNSDGQPYADYRSVIVYDIPSNSWSVDSSRISGKRHWMATAEYAGGLYVLGGIDSTSWAVDIVEEIVPQGTAVGILKKNSLPATYKIDQNYPNPFNPITHIRYALPKTSSVKIEVFNVLGQRVLTLENKRKLAGYHVVDFNGSNLSSGVYLYRMQAADYSVVKKMMLMK